MGSDLKVDRVADRRSYLSSLSIWMPLRWVSTKMAVEYLKFVLATDRSPQLDWRYGGGNFQEATAHHAIMHVS